MKIISILYFFLYYYTNIVKRYKIICLNRIWRKKNKHNFTVIGNPIWQELFPINKVYVGRATYGSLHVVPYNETDGNLIIGSYCSIARDVKFLLGGNHDYKYFTTYPLKKYSKKIPNHTYSKGDIVVKDDVWLGENVLVLSGVTIGQGAIVGANTVVSKDVEPYSIVAGNPMRFLKYRFPTIVIEQMKQLNFELITPDLISENYELVNEEINEINVVNIINKLK